MATFWLWIVGVAAVCAAVLGLIWLAGEPSGGILPYLLTFAGGTLVGALTVTVRAEMRTSNRRKTDVRNSGRFT
jgi:zinc transporter ZupT